MRGGKWKTKGRQVAETSERDKWKGQVEKTSVRDKWKRQAGDKCRTTGRQVEDKRETSRRDK